MTAVDDRPAVILARQDEETRDYHCRSIRELESEIGEKLAAMRRHLYDLDRWDADSFAAALRLLVIGFMNQTGGGDAAKRLIEHFADSDDQRRFGSDVARFFQHAKLTDCPGGEDSDCDDCPDCDFYVIRLRYSDPQGDDVAAILADAAAGRQILYDTGVPRPSWLTFPSSLLDQDRARAEELECEIEQRRKELDRIEAGWPAPAAREFVRFCG